MKSPLVTLPYTAPNVLTLPSVRPRTPSVPSFKSFLTNDFGNGFERHVDMVRNDVKDILNEASLGCMQPVSKSKAKQKIKVIETAVDQVLTIRICR